MGKSGIAEVSPGSAAMSSNLASTMVGTAGLTYPVWARVIGQGHDVILALLGLAVLLLTIRAKLLEIRVKRAELRRLERGGPE